MALTNHRPLVCCVKDENNPFSESYQQRQQLEKVQQQEQQRIQMAQHMEQQRLMQHMEGDSPGGAPTTAGPQAMLSPGGAAIHLPVNLCLENCSLHTVSFTPA